MTIVAVWYESREDRIWCIADTRVSRPGTLGGRIVLTDYAAKIFSLSVKCIDMRDPVDTRSPFFERTFGFAFAGDTLPALMTFATANALLPHLVADGKSEIPSLIEIAELVRKLAERFMNEIWTANNRQGASGIFEAVVFGFCSYADTYEIHKLSSVEKNGKLSVSSENKFGSSEIVILGAGEKTFYEHLQNLRSDGDPVGRILRLPLLAVREMVKSSESTSDVGGKWSVGSASEAGFRIFYSAEPIITGKTQGFRHYNGIDLDHELGPMGKFTIGDVGMM